MKKIFSIFVIVCIILLQLPIHAEISMDKSVDFVSGLGVMSGYPDGSFGESGLVTRAELAKIVTVMNNIEVPRQSNISPYNDVPYYHWAAAYIDAATRNGYFTGYPDGNFYPENTVTYEELCKVMLEMLGYTAQTQTYSWAEAQINQAKKVGILAGTDFAAYKNVTRLDTAKIIKNTLLTIRKGTGNYCIENMELKYIENVIILSDNTASDNWIQTSAGTFKKGSLTNDCVMKQGDLILNKDNEIVLFFPVDYPEKTYTVKSVLKNSIMTYEQEELLTFADDVTVYQAGIPSVYKNAVLNIGTGDKLTVYYSKNGEVRYLNLKKDAGSRSTSYIIRSVLGKNIIAFNKNDLLKFDDDTVVYQGNLASNYAAALSNFEMGDKLTVYYTDNNMIKYLKLEKDSMDGPFTYGSGQIVPDSFTTVVRDGKIVSLSDLQPYDICYYEPESNVLIAYINQFSGTYDDALPNKDSVSKVVLSGKTFEISTAAAFEKLSSGGIPIGDMVTVCLDKDGKVADVIPFEKNSSVVGYILSTGLKDKMEQNKEISSLHYINVLLTDGQTAQYITDRDYSNYRGRLVDILFSNGKASIKTIPQQKNIYGQFQASKLMLGQNKLSSDLKIIDIAKYKEHENGKGARIYPSRIDGCNFSASDILYYEKNESGEINRLVLNDYTNDLYQYGIVIKAEKDENLLYTQGYYKIIIDGKINSLITTNVLYGVSSHNPAMLKVENGQINWIKKLTFVDDIISKADVQYAYGKKAKYKVSSNLAVYKEVYDTENSGITYQKITLSDIPDNARIKAYSDKSEQNGGRIRVLVVAE